MDDNIWVRDGLEPMNKSKLADVLDGMVEPEVYEEEMSRTNGAENGVGENSSQASVEAMQRQREVMLLRAVAEKYGKVLSSAGTDADSMINEFLGPAPEGNSSTVKGPVDVDMIEENEVSGTSNKSSSSSSLTNSFFSTKKVKEANVDLIERSKHVPLRLTIEQRKVLRLCEAALDVSEYTDKVDVLSWKSKTGRIHEQIRDICAVLSGLAIAADYEVGQKMIKDRSFEDNAEYFATVFEIGRRHKILNPERMRTDYGKLIHLLMDSQSPEVQRLLEFRLVKRVSTVHDFLQRRNCLRLLEHQDAVIATTAIIDNKLTGKSRADIQREIKAKDKAVKRLVQQFSNQGYGRSEADGLSDEEIEWCLYSMGDNSSFLVFNRDPVDKMILLLKRYFGSDSSRKQQEKELGLDSDDDSPEREESSKSSNKAYPRRSLAIQSGHKGARLTHDHNRQYQFALQTLTLWREIQNDMFKLWCLAEDDLLDPDNYYSLRDTGQGLNRIQSAPRIGRAMSEILRRAQRSLGSWIGSSVVHLGDHNVPNALTFIDKYTQVPRILNPIVNVIEAIPQLVNENKGGLGDLIKKNYGSAEECQISILQDFFKHAFDGSGADNFYDAGSCIDGRLTSAWNWCNKLDKKDYYPIFKLAGFTGFDGNFKG